MEHEPEELIERLRELYQDRTMLTKAGSMQRTLGTPRVNRGRERVNLPSLRGNYGSQGQWADE